MQKRGLLRFIKSEVSWLFRRKKGDKIRDTTHDLVKADSTILS